MVQMFGHVVKSNGISGLYKGVRKTIYILTTKSPKTKTKEKDPSSKYLLMYQNSYPPPNSAKQPTA